MSLGGGELQHFGLNSNTSARGFLKCAYKKRDVAAARAGGSDSKDSGKKASGESASPPPKRKKQAEGDDEESEEELAEDSERGDGSDEDASPEGKKQWQTVPLNAFKDFY
jgi:hypothetical protein